MEWPTVATLKGPPSTFNLTMAYNKCTYNLRRSLTTAQHSLSPVLVSKSLIFLILDSLSLIRLLSLRRRRRTQLSDRTIRPISYRQEELQEAIAGMPSAYAMRAGRSKTQIRSQLMAKAVS